MRNLYRGKRVDNKEWVYGYYFCLHHNDKRTHIHHFIIPLDTPLPKDRPIGDIQVEIIPESLGQCADIPDKIGKMIFDGDIIKIYEGSENDGYCVCKVYSYHGVLCVDYKTPDWVFNALAFLDSDNVFAFEVIGNIHDNPELLKGEGV